MSQTLTLVVIASVLMMTALTVAVLGRSTLLDSSNNLDRDSCVQAVSGACGFQDSITPPSACTEQDIGPGDLEQISGEEEGKWTCANSEG